MSTSVAINNEASELRTAQEQAVNKRARTALVVATVFTLIFMVVEIVGGYLARSLAIMTDAAHLLTDVGAMCISLFAMHIATRPSNSQMTFGYHRAEILGALASIVTIWALVGILLYEAVNRLIDDVKRTGKAVDGELMAIIGGCGLLVNVIDAAILHWGNATAFGHGHSHGGGGDHGHGHGGASTSREEAGYGSTAPAFSVAPSKKGPAAASTSSGGHGHSHAGGGHGHSHSGGESDHHSDHHDDEITGDERSGLIAGPSSSSGGGHGHSHGGKKAKEESGHGHSHGGEGGNINVRAAFIHVLGDCLQSVGVIIASLIIWIGNQVTYGTPKHDGSLYNIADPIASLLFGIITLFTTFNLLKRITNVLMQRVPDSINYDQLLRELSSLPGVQGVHDLHVWDLSFGKICLSVHIHSDEHFDTLHAAMEVCERHGIFHNTIQVDHPSLGKCDPRALRY